MNCDTPFQVIIVGAGPVGMLLACLLGQQQIPTLLLEKRSEPLRHSQAIGITPPSLHILEQLQLTPRFLQHGVKVVHCVVHGEGRRRLGCLNFSNIPDEYRFILALPQSETIRLLHEKLASFPSVTSLEGFEVVALRQDTHQVYVTCTNTAEENQGVTSTFSAPYLCASDGSRSRIRELCQIPFSRKSYGCHFVMGDFVDRSGLNAEAHLYFSSEGSVESFPLPEGKRRWIVQTPQPLSDPPVGLISDLVEQRSGWKVASSDQLNQNTFTPQRLHCARYREGRVLLLGDAAHVMSPIGGQGMNIGFADAELLAEALTTILQHNAPPDPLFRSYQRHRQRAARIAIFRAGSGMRLGTWPGKPAAAIRDFLLDRVFLNGPFRRAMGPFFAMLTIPHHHLHQALNSKHQFSGSQPTQSILL